MADLSLVHLFSLSLVLSCLSLSLSLLLFLFLSFSLALSRSISLSLALSRSISLSPSLSLSLPLSIGRLGAFDGCLSAVVQTLGFLSISGLREACCAFAVAMDWGPVELGFGKKCRSTRRLARNFTKRRMARTRPAKLRRDEASLPVTDRSRRVVSPGQLFWPDSFLVVSLTLLFSFAGRVDFCSHLTKVDLLNGYRVFFSRRSTACLQAFGQMRSARSRYTLGRLDQVELGGPPFGLRQLKNKWLHRPSSGAVVSFVFNGRCLFPSKNNYTEKSNYRKSRAFCCPWPLGVSENHAGRLQRMVEGECKCVSASLAWAKGSNRFQARCAIDRRLCYLHNICRTSSLST